MRVPICLSVLAFLLVIGDCVSTYLCLSTVSEQYRVYEANLLSDLVFGWVGMVPGLVIMGIGKALGLVFLCLVYARRPKRRAVVILGLLFLVLMTAYVNANNWSIYWMLKG